MIRKVLVYTFGSQSHEAAIRTAAAFATKHKAELTGLFVKSDIGGYSSVYGGYPLNLAETYFETQKEYEKKARAQFDEVTSHYDTPTQWHNIDEVEREHNPAFYADYIFVRQPDKQDSVIFNDTEFVDHLITSTGIPTVIVPKDWSSDSFAERPVLAWKETREAAGAVRQTLALMREASDLDIVSINKRSDPDKELIDGIRISEYLTEHGIRCKFTTERMTENDRNEAQTLLRHLDSHNRDLVIMGGYGHSRLRQIILGGMTRMLIKKSTVPVLLSH